MIVSTPILLQYTAIISWILPPTIYVLYLFINMYGRSQPSQMNSNLSQYPLPYPVAPNVSHQSTTAVNYYPSVNPSIPVTVPSHPLDGIPFKLSPALELFYSNSDSESNRIFEDVKNTLDRVKNLLDSSQFTYDCALERNFLRDHEKK